MDIHNSNSKWRWIVHRRTIGRELGITGNADAGGACAHATSSCAVCARARRARGLDMAPAPAAVHLLVSRAAELGFALLNHLREPLDHFGVRMAEEA